MTPTAIQEAFIQQAQACEALGSAFMGQLMRLCATQTWPEGVVRDRIFAWEGDVSPAGQSVPLRLAGGLHALLLQGHVALETAYPPRDIEDTQLWNVVAKTLVTDAPHMLKWLESPPQTNEVRRSAALIAVGHVLTKRFGLPMRTSELGASGGLNLHWDRYGLDLHGQTFGATDPVLTLTPTWKGPVLPETPAIVTEHAGVDINPLNPQDPSDALRLQSYLWPDQADRLILTKSAIAAARTPVAKGDAVDWLASRLGHKAGQLHLIYSTVAWQYFPQDKQDFGTELIEAAGASAKQNAPLAWFRMENDSRTPGAALTLRLWPDDITIDLGRADFHGRWITWNGMD